MGIGDIRYTVLQVVAEVFRKLNMTAPSSLTQNKLATQCVDFINDVCNDLADFGDWQETLTSANITAVSGRRDYTINTSANVENIKDIYFSTRRGPLHNISPEQMRIITRSTITGTPTQFTLFMTDSNGNPVIRVRPTPAASEDGELFSVLYYIRAPLYTTSDASTVIPFPGRLVVLGTLARIYLNESQGAPSDKYTAAQQEYLTARKEALNRFNGDTGWSISFVPSQFGRGHK